MPNESSSNQRNASSQPRGDLTQPRTQASYTLVIAVVALILLCAGLAALNHWGVGLPKSGPADETIISAPSSLFSSAPISSAGYVYISLPGANNQHDLFLYNVIVTPNLQMLTNSPGVSEIWPVASPDGGQLAYFGVNMLNGAPTEVSDLYVLAFANMREHQITKNTGTAQLHRGFEIDKGHPPAWSFDGKWLAFLARQIDQQGNAVMLYVVRSDGTVMKVIGEAYNRVYDFAWLSDDVITYAEWRGDGQKNAYMCKLVSSVCSPTLITTIPTNP